MQGKIVTEGADIYYEKRGDGPALLIIQGGLSEAGATEQLAEVLAAEYQVITYDRRGLSRSTASPEVPPTLSRHAADAAAILATVTTEPARVVGASIGALIGLYLAAEHPERVATLIAHEPPMSSVVWDPEREAAMDKVGELSRQDMRAAIQMMGALTSAGQTTSEEGARPGASVGDLDANLRSFFEHDFPAVRQSELDAERVAAIATTVIPTGGAESHGQWEHRCAEQLARRLGRPLVELPGGHGALISHPWATATRLRSLFADPV